MQLTQKQDTIAKLILFGLTLLSAGSLYKPSFISVDASADIIGISHGLLLFFTGAYAIVTGGPTVASAIGKTAASLVVFGMLSMLLTPTRAEAASVTTQTFAKAITDINTKFAGLNGKFAKIGAPIGLTGSVTTDVNALITKLQNISLADLKAAKADADATMDALASACYAPLIDLVTAQQSVTAPTQDVENPGANVPSTHLILTFQRLRDFRNALQPTSPVGVGCAPLAQQVKTDVLTLVAQIAAGTVTLATFGL